MKPFLAIQNPVRPVRQDMVTVTDISVGTSDSSKYFGAMYPASSRAYADFVTVASPFNVADAATDTTGSAIRELSMSIAGLRNDIQELTKAIKTVLPGHENVLIFRDISKEDAIREISELMQRTQQEMYPSDISEQLRIDYDLVVEVLNDLSAAGKIE